jgi:hypothetical protein
VLDDTASIGAAPGRLDVAGGVVSILVMGGSMGEMGPFDGTVVLTPATAQYGAILSFTVSMEDGHVWEASVVRVEFAASGS